MQDCSVAGWSERAITAGILGLSKSEDYDEVKAGVLKSTLGVGRMHTI